jgi:hypothetical protein
MLAARCYRRTKTVQKNSLFERRSTKVTVSDYRDVMRIPTKLVVDARPVALAPLQMELFGCLLGLFLNVIFAT